MTISDRDKAMLDFERRWWHDRGNKAEAIHAEFDVSVTRYYQLLNRLLDTPEALAHDPLTVKRLRRLRDRSKTPIQRRLA